LTESIKENEQTNLSRVIEDLRPHKAEQLADLRILLNAGWTGQTPAALVSLKSMARPMSTTYFGTPSATKFCSWPPGTVKVKPPSNSWPAQLA
jgi:hypothetical protein